MSRHLSNYPDVIPVTNLDPVRRMVLTAPAHEARVVRRWLDANERLQAAEPGAPLPVLIQNWRAARDAMRLREVNTPRRSELK